jgi:hypothetical protein
MSENPDPSNNSIVESVDKSSVSDSNPLTTTESQNPKPEVQSLSAEEKGKRGNYTLARGYEGIIYQSISISSTRPPRTKEDQQGE